MPDSATVPLELPGISRKLSAVLGILPGLRQRAAVSTGERPKLAIWLRRRSSNIDLVSGFTRRSVRELVRLKSTLKTKGEKAMPKRKQESDDVVQELLTKLITINLWNAGASQDSIARSVGKAKLWVNKFLQGVPKPR